MLTLGNIFVLMLFASAAAWWWHAHGLREKALARVKQHCARLELQLLDDAVALRRLTFARDAQGRKRLARVYGFEFTVTGEQRHPRHHHDVRRTYRANRTGPLSIRNQNASA